MEGDCPRQYLVLGLSACKIHEMSIYVIPHGDQITSKNSFKIKLSILLILSFHYTLELFISFKLNQQEIMGL